MANLLICSALGPNKSEILGELAVLATESQCKIADMRASALGEEMCVCFVLSGHWNALAKFEHQIQALAPKLDLQVHIKRSKIQQHSEALLPYTVQIFTGESSSLISDVTTFFIQQGIVIQELFSNTYAAHQTDATVTVLNLAIGIPAQHQINAVRDAFQILCDECNLDGILEPIKN